MIGKADVLWTGSAVIVARTTELAEQLLTGGDLRCPRCGDGRLDRLGLRPPPYDPFPRHGDRDDQASPHPMRVLLVHPRRDARRAATRRADTTAVIGTALLHKANGLGHRRIAVAIDRPVSTVRRWLRRLPPAHLDRIHRDGVQRLLRLDPDTFTALRYDGNMLRHALSVLSAATTGTDTDAAFSTRPGP